VNFTWRIGLVYLKPDACARARHSRRWHTHHILVATCTHVTSTLGVLGIGAIMLAELDREVGHVLLFDKNALANHTRGSQQDLNNQVQVQSGSTSWLSRSPTMRWPLTKQISLAPKAASFDSILNHWIRHRAPLLYLFVFFWILRRLDRWWRCRFENQAHVSVQRWDEYVLLICTRVNLW